MDSLDAAALGAALLNEEAAASICAALNVGDFTTPFAKDLFETICGLWSDGHSPSPTFVVSRMDHEYDPDYVERMIADLVVDTPAVSTIGSTIRFIKERSRKRYLALQVGNLSEMVNGGDDPETVLKAMSKAIAEIEARSVSGLPDDLVCMADLKAHVEMRHAGARDWIIPGMLRRRWRAMFVAGEGCAKSTILRQCGVMCAAGKHPFAPSVQMKPVVTLNIDAENPLEVVEHQFDIIMDVTRLDPSEIRNAHIWACEGGLDLRSANGQGQFEAVLEEIQPDLVTIGPIYKLGQRRGDDWDEAAVEILLFLDKMRVKYDCALLLEHHAPQQQSDGSRQIRPFGSSAWLRWPEFGVKMVAQDRDQIGQPHKIEIGYWRPPRVSKASWPEALERSSVLAPWLGVWPPGHWSGEREAS